MKTILTLTRPLAILLYGFIYVPIIIVLVFSFNSARDGMLWQGFSIHWYREIFTNDLMLAAMGRSFFLAIGTLLGYGLSRYRFPGKRLFDGFLHVPLFVPDIVSGVAILLFYSFIRAKLDILALGMTTMVLAHVTFQIPFVAIIVCARLKIWDDSLEEAAAVMGASPTQRYRKITLPLLIPGIIAGGLMAFTLSLDDFVVSYFTASPEAPTMPIVIYNTVKEGITAEVNALSAILIIATTISVISITLLQRARKLLPD
ncbi:MAG: ABC transporter permease [Verrucomicrobiia bacterium]|jgi:spermidine/putrescine transport system permease protein